MADFDPDTEESVLSADDSATTEDTTAAASGDDAELVELRRELAEAGPRLEAFAALEALAEARGTTPELIAMDASIDALEAEKSAKESELADLLGAARAAEAERNEHVEERDMLVKQQTKIQDDIVVVLDEHTALVDQMAELIDELEAIRADAVRLLGEKASLEMNVDALRREYDALNSGVAARSGGLGVSIETDHDEANAFDRFFEAEVVEDKARAWMLK